MSNLNSNTGFGLQGFVDIEIHNPNDGVSRRYKHNFLTKVGKQLLLDGIVGRALNMNASTFGNTMTVNGMNKVAASDVSNYTGNIYDNRYTMANMLLNLGDKAATMSENTTYIPLHNEEFTEASKVVGYATSNVVPITDGKEGSIDYTRGEYVVDAFTVAERWKYPEGVATGTVDTIAMMPASSMKKNGAGFKFAKCLDRVNLQYTNYVSQSTGFLPPGVAGYTANDEILLNFNQDGCNRWKYNINTGEVKKVADSEKFFVLDFGSNTAIRDFIEFSGYYYVAITSSYNMTIEVYDTNFNTVNTFYANTNTSNVTYDSLRFYKTNDKLYMTISCQRNNSYLAESTGRLFECVKGSGGYCTSANKLVFSDVLTSIPAGFGATVRDTWNLCVGSYGSKYILYVGIEDREANANNERLYVGYVFTDINNIKGTIVDCIQGINPTSIMFDSGSFAGMLQIGGFGNGASGATDSASGYVYNYQNCKKYIKNNSNEVKVNTTTNGCWLSLDGWWGNAISIVKLNTPLEITDEDIVYVSYGYKIV